MSNTTNTIQIIIGDLDVTKHVLIKNGVKIQRTLHNKGISVIDTARFTLKNSPSLARFLIDKSAIPMVSVIINNNNTVVFTGHLRKGLSIDIKAHYAPEASEIDIEAVDVLEALNSRTKTSLDNKDIEHYEERRHNLIRSIRSKSTLPSYAVDWTGVPDDTIKRFVEEEDKSPKELLDTILFPIGMVAYHDETGLLHVSSWDYKDDTNSPMLNECDGIGDSIKFTQREVQKQDVIVERYQTKTIENYTLFHEYYTENEPRYDYTKDGKGLPLGGKLGEHEKKYGYKLIKVEPDTLYMEYDGWANAKKSGWNGGGYTGSICQVKGTLNFEYGNRKHVGEQSAVGKWFSFHFHATMKKLDRKFLSCSWWWDKVSASGDWRQRLHIWIRGTATFERVDGDTGAEIRTGKTKKLKGFPVYTEDEAIALGEHYTRLLDNSGYTFSFNSTKRLALGQAFVIDLPTIDTRTTIRVRKRQEMISPDIIIYKYECEKIQPLDKSVKLVSTYIQEVAIPQKIEETFATVDDLTRKINDTLASDVGGGSNLNVNVSVNNRDITLRVYHDQDNKSWMYKYEISTDKSNWAVMKQSTDRIAVYTVTQSEENKTYYFRVSGMIAGDTSGHYLVSPTVSTTVKKISFDDLTSTSNFKVNNLDVKGDLVVRGTETKVNTTNLNIKDQMIDINVGETGDGVSMARNGKRTAGIRVKRGKKDDTVLAYNEDTNNWQVDGSDIGTIYPIGFVYTQYPYELPPQSGNFLYSHMRNDYHAYKRFAVSGGLRGVRYINSGGRASNIDIVPHQIEGIETWDGNFWAGALLPRIYRFGIQGIATTLGEIKFYHLKPEYAFIARNHKGQRETRTTVSNYEIGGTVFGQDFFDVDKVIKVSGPSLGFSGRWIIFTPYRNNGAFFRSEGGRARDFGGEMQEDAFQKHEHRYTAYRDGEEDDGDTRNDFIEGQPTQHTTHGIVSQPGYDTPRTANETRPRNLTMRLWRRIG